MATTAVHLRALPSDNLSEALSNARDAIFYDNFDGMYSQTTGSLHITVYVEGDPVAEAQKLISRLEDVLKIRTVEIEQDLVNMADIAERVGRTKESVRLLVQGKRGPGAFPEPVAMPGGLRVWDWAEVNRWFRTHLRIGDLEDGLSRPAMFALNHWLANRSASAAEPVSRAV